MKVLVAGASGLVGRAAVKRFTEAGFDVVGVSRRVPADLGAPCLSVDLLDPAACAEAFGDLRDVTHVVYAALQETPGLFAGWFDEENIERNAAMLRNLFEPLAAAAPGLQHVSLLHGTKAYGFHHPEVGMAGLRIPLREREPRRPHRNFYFEQEGYLLDRRGDLGFGLTTFRPTVIWGDATGANMNPALPLAAWAALLRDAGEPLHFPGRGDGLAIVESVDAGIVADALVWAATSPSASGGTYNLTNGDAFRWLDVWPAIAAAFGMEAGEHRPTALAEELPGHAARWAGLHEQHGLTGPRDLVELVGANSLVYIDFLLSAHSGGTPVLNSTIAARQAGFSACVDSEDAFVTLFRSLQDQGLVPRP